MSTPVWPAGIVTVAAGASKSSRPGPEPSTLAVLSCALTSSVMSWNVGLEISARNVAVLDALPSLWVTFSIGCSVGTPSSSVIVTVVGFSAPPAARAVLMSFSTMLKPSSPSCVRSPTTPTVKV